MNGKTLKEKAVPMAAAVLSHIIAFLFFQRFNPEIFFKNESDPVSLDTIWENPSVSYAGKLPGADTTYTLYMVDDEWDQEQHFTIFIIRLGASALLFFVLAVGLVLAAGKIFHR